MAAQKGKDKKQLLDEKQLLHTLIDNMPDFIYIKDADGNYIVANQKIMNIHGLQSIDQLIGKSDHDFYPGELADKQRRNELDILRTGKPLINHEEISLDENGEEIFLSTTKVPLKDAGGIIIGVVVIGRDITDRRMAEKKLAEHADHLRLIKQEQDKFISIIAHDLKNPLHSIMGFTDLLIKNYDDFEDPKKQEFLGLIYESSQYANDLLDNLLQWSRAQTDRIRYSPNKFDLHSLAEEIKGMLHGNAEKKQLALLNLIPVASCVYADRNMIHAVLRNLLSNSIKFTPEGGTISVEAVPQEDFFQVSVKDDGVGIPLDKQGKLFSFEALHSTSGTAGEPGTGLGLIVCSEFIKKHGAELSLHSVPGKGTTFTFKLPSREPFVGV